MKEVQLDKHVKLLSTAPESCLRQRDLLVKFEKLADPVSPVSKMLRPCTPEKLTSIYKILAFSTVGSSWPLFVGRSRSGHRCRCSDSTLRMERRENTTLYAASSPSDFVRAPRVGYRGVKSEGDQSIFAGGSSIARKCNQTHPCPWTPL